jgi:hypothetical protein
MNAVNLNQCEYDKYGVPSFPSITMVNNSPIKELARVAPE